MTVSPWPGRHSTPSISASPSSSPSCTYTRAACVAGTPSGFCSCARSAWAQAARDDLPEALGPTTSTIPSRSISARFTPSRFSILSFISRPPSAVSPRSE